MFAKSSFAMKDLIPMDLGGVCLPVDLKLIEMVDPFEIFFFMNDFQYKN
jgi:hypothetical protein